jgi:hypothetical protein
MEHLFDCGPLEQSGQQVIPLVVTMKMEIHVLMKGGDLFAHCLVEEFDAVLMHRAHLEKR